MFKKSILTLLALQLWSTTPLSAGRYNLDDIDEKYQTTYNILPAVEESDHLLKERSCQFSKLLEDAESIVVRYGMETHVGLRLVHSHFSVGKDQIMLEESQTFEDKPSLITCAFNLEEAKEKKALPASWIFSNHKEEDVQIFETSTDSAVHSGIHMLQENPGFMDEMGDLLRTTQFNSLLALALVKRDYLVAKEDEMYMEVSEEDPQRSIVQILKDNQMPKLTIRTSWSFKGPKQQSCSPYTFCARGSDGSHRAERRHTHIPN